MRNINIFVFLLATIGLSFTSTNWELFQSFDGKFQVLTPGEMIEKVNPIKTEI